MLTRFCRAEDGNYAVILTIAMIPILSGVAGVVDFVGTSNDASVLQNSLDATALAIATEYDSGMTKPELQAFGAEFFNANMEDTTAGELEYLDQAVGFDVSAAAEGNSHIIGVSSSITHKGMMGSPDFWRASRTSYVRVRPGEPACLLALDKQASGAVTIQGSTQVQMDGCVIAANSHATDAVSRGGSAKLDAECVSTVGGTAGLSSSTKLACGTPLEDQYASLDPLAGIGPPAYTACKSMPGGKTKSLTPGTFCNKTWSGDITLDPGVYILRGGQVKLGGNGRLVGQGVTIFLMEGATFDSNANEVIDLSPPTSATNPYAGITIYQEKANTAQLTINGGSGSLVTGFVYAPGAHVFYAGNSTMSGSGDCIRVIGKTVEMTGNSAVKADCSAELGGRKMYAGRIILLVK
jgi:Flp pilus assembly protein TadG